MSCHVLVLLTTTERRAVPYLRCGCVTARSEDYTKEMLFAKQVAVSFLVPARPLCCLRSCLVGSGRGGLPLTRSRA